MYQIEKERKYGVRYSAHGFDYVPKAPEFTLSLAEAEQEVINWKCFADTVGGLAIIVERPEKS